VAFSGFENTTATNVTILRATPRIEGGLVVDDISLERPGTAAQAQPGITSAPILYSRTNEPVVTIPITSTVPAHKWAQFVVRVHLGSEKQSGELRSVTLTYVVTGQRFRTDYQMPFFLCRDAADPTSRSCCAQFDQNCGMIG
jgi:hypothetical protein